MRVSVNEFEGEVLMSYMQHSAVCCVRDSPVCDIPLAGCMELLRVDIVDQQLTFRIWFGSCTQ